MKNAWMQIALAAQNFFKNISLFFSCFKFPQFGQEFCQFPNLIKGISSLCWEVNPSAYCKRQLSLLFWVSERGDIISLTVVSCMFRAKLPITKVQASQGPKGILSFLPIKSGNYLCLVLVLYNKHLITKFWEYVKLLPNGLLGEVNNSLKV